MVKNKCELAIERNGAFATRGTFTCYSPYGYSEQPLRSRSLPSFNAERLDRVSGCYLLGNGHRCYSPVLMRFLSPDRLSPFDAGGANAYVYCAADPINKSDPTGQVWKWVRGLFRVNARPQAHRSASGQPTVASIAAGNPNRAKIDNDLRFILKPEEGGNLRTNLNRLLGDRDFSQAAKVELGTVVLDSLESNQKAWEQLQGGYRDRPHVMILASDQEILNGVNKGLSTVLSTHITPERADRAFRTLQEMAGSKLNRSIRLQLEQIRKNYSSAMTTF